MRAAGTLVMVLAAGRLAAAQALDGSTDELVRQPLSLARCVTIALERNPALRAARHGERAAAAHVGEERSTFFPKLALDAGITRANTPKLRDEGHASADESRALLVGSLLLFEGGARGGRLAGARAEQAVAMALVDAAALDLATAVAIAYYERLAAEGMAQVAADTVVQVATHVKLAEARLASGVAARYDVLKARTEKAEADLLLVRARGTLRVTEGALARTMGLPVALSLAIEPMPEDVPAQALSDVRRLAAVALEQRPELRAARARIESRRAELRVATAGYLPSVGAAADVGLGAASLVPDRGRWTVGLGVSVPLFEGLLTPARRARASAEEARALDEHALTQQDVEFEVWTAATRFGEAQEARAAAAILVASADESARVADGMYRNGVASIIELVDAQAAQTAARNRRVLAILDFHAAAARLARALGQQPATSRPAAIAGGRR